MTFIVTLVTASFYFHNIPISFYHQEHLIAVSTYFILITRTFITPYFIILHKVICDLGYSLFSSLL